MLSLSLASLRFALFPFSLPSWLTWSRLLTFFSLHPYDSCHWLPFAHSFSFEFSRLCLQSFAKLQHTMNLPSCVFPYATSLVLRVPECCYCLLSFNFVPGTHFSCNTQMKKKFKLLGKTKSLMRCPAYAIFPALVFILYKFSDTFAKISSTVSYAGQSMDSLAWWQGETTPVTCPKWTKALRLNSLKWTPQKGGICNVKMEHFKQKTF